MKYIFSLKLTNNRGLRFFSASLVVLRLDNALDAKV